MDGLWPNLDATCVYAVAGKSNFGAFDAPPSTTDIFIVGDDDGGGAKDVLPTAQSLAKRYANRGVRVHLLMPPPLPAQPKTDCNDWSRSFATADEWRHAFCLAVDRALHVKV